MALVSAHEFFTNPYYFGKTTLRAEHATALNVLEKEPRRWMHLSSAAAAGKTTFGHHALAKFLYDSATVSSMASGPQAIMVSGSYGSLNAARFLCSTFLGYLHSFGGVEFNKEVILAGQTKTQLFFSGPRKIEIHFTDEKISDMFGRNVIGAWLDGVPGDFNYYEECIRRVKLHGNNIDTLLITT
jgi:hypothetical protein